MSLAEIHALNAAVDAAIAAFVAEAIRTHGVPTSAEEVAALAASVRLALRLGFIRVIVLL